MNETDTTPPHDWPRDVESAVVPTGFGDRGSETLDGADKQMTSSALRSILHEFGCAGIAVWLDGGWGVDALLGRQTRPHADVDIIVRVADLQKLREALGLRGFSERAGGATSNFVLVDRTGLEIDVHAVTFDTTGNGVYRMANGDDWIYPSTGSTGYGTIDGVAVRCLSPEAQVLCHVHGYEPTEKDCEDMEHLRLRFGVHLPPHLRRRT